MMLAVCGIDVHREVCPVKVVAIMLPHHLPLFRREKIPNCLQNGRMQIKGFRRNLKSERQNSFVATIVLYGTNNLYQSASSLFICIRATQDRTPRLRYLLHSNYGRGNLSFTSINLPRLAIQAQQNIERFYALLDDKLMLVRDQLMERLGLQSARKAKCFPFLMGQGVWLDSEHLKPDDTVGDVLKHGTLSIGFIGLAETLVALTGKHHGQSRDAQQLGLEIVSRMRAFTDQCSDELRLNFSLLATPAEGLSGRFVELDRKRYGELPGITDRQYYTNSFHVPVYFGLTAYQKIQLEAPYHALANGGHITYVEMDGDPLNNLPAFEKIIRCMHDAGIGYGSVNHPVDRDPACGYTGIIKDACPKCGRLDGMQKRIAQRETELADYLEAKPQMRTKRVYQKRCNQIPRSQKLRHIQQQCPKATIEWCRVDTENVFVSGEVTYRISHPDYLPQKLSGDIYYPMDRVACVRWNGAHRFYTQGLDPIPDNQIIRLAIPDCGAENRMEE